MVVCVGIIHSHPKASGFPGCDSTLSCIFTVTSAYINEPKAQVTLPNQELCHLVLVPVV